MAAAAAAAAASLPPLAPFLMENEPAKPVLASSAFMSQAHGSHLFALSSLLSGKADDDDNNNDNDNDDHNDEDKVRHDHHRPQRDRRRVRTGCESVDAVLGSGLIYGDGGVCFISGQKDGGGGGADGGVSGGAGGVDELYQGLLISHLLSTTTTTTTITAASPSPSATIIDTLGTFDVLKLHRAIISRLESNVPHHHPKKNGAAQDPRKQQQEPNMAEMAARILEGVKIMRVFDFEGVVEGVGEMAEGLRDRSLLLLSQVPRQQTEDAVARVEEEEKSSEGVKRSLERVKSTIADSQGDEDEMLDDLPGVELPPLLEAGVEVEGKLDKDNGGEMDEGAKRKQEAKREEKCEDECNMLIIDDITSVVAPLMKSNYIQGQALLTTFLRSLSHTARQHNICVLVTNSTLTYKDDTEAPSAFSSIVSRPALGKSLGYLVDVHLLVNRIPRAQRDARAAALSYASGRGSGGYRGGRKVEWVNVVEVLQDREDGRFGRVGVFTVDSRTGMLTNAF